jgi:hypothetical protein
MNAMEFAEMAKQKLAKSSCFAKDFCDLRMEFSRKYQGGLIFSTAIGGPEFFDTIINYLNPANSGQKYPEKGEYDKNFNKWILKQKI